MTTSNKRVLTVYSHRDWGGEDSTTRLFAGYGFKPVVHPDGADIIVFNGGEDIATSIYGERPISAYIPEHPSHRDRTEMQLFDEYKDRSDKMIVGICRGAQLLNCLNGGKLFQDVNNHTRSHDMLDIKTGKVFRATSTHHQQMIPGAHGEIVAIASESTVKHNEANRQNINPGDIQLGADMEIMWYPGHRTLCIQGHPEYVPGSAFADYCIGLIHGYFKESVTFAA